MSSTAVMPADPAAVAAALPTARRVLVLGPMGSGKSTLAAGLARFWAPDVMVLSADPGTPAFGVPGAVSLGRPWDGGWACVATEPLCTLDAARFRLPLTQAVARLAGRVTEARLLLDAPGLVRGVGAAELLQGFAAAADIDALVLLDPDALAPLAGDLAALGRPIVRVRPDAAAHRPPRSERERYRTELWNAHLAQARSHRLVWSDLHLAGTPPPIGAAPAWCGRQVALLRRAEPVALGEVRGCDQDGLTLDLVGAPDGATTLLVRDAQRNDAGMLATAPPLGAGRPQRPAPVRSAQAPLDVGVNGVQVTLANGVIGDPLVRLRVPNQSRRLLFDLGDTVGLPVKALHAVTDVFVTHGHIDHIGGFPWLLRARLSGDPPPCRLYGPPGLREHIAGFVAGVRWDRIGDSGPVFLVGETDGRTLVWSRIQPGLPVALLETEPVQDGVLLETPALRVRATLLDHGIPVLAFALELPDVQRVDEAALARLGLPPGPWLGELKRRVASGEQEAAVTLPDGRRLAAGALAEALLRAERGIRIAYATDLADTEPNAERLAKLAHRADLLICESAFLPEDAAQARATGHLTTDACARIAARAQAARLLPFHFSRRYSQRLPEVADALRRACFEAGFQGELVQAV
ncbi:MAG TPA: MBL fold metallo-hydrolase [Pseudomonadales bacterium]